MHQVQQLRLERLADAPEYLVGNLVHAVPAGLVGKAVLPAEAEVAVEGFVPVGGEEGRHVHRVGDVVHRVLGRGDLRPHVGADACEKRRRGCARHRCGSVSRAGQGRHVEFAAAAAADAAHAEQAFAVEAGCAELAEVVHHHVVGEMVVAGGHRRVRGEHGVGRGRFQGGGERHALPVTSSRMRSSTRKAAWPSLMCQTVGCSPSAASARTPPTPSRISCSMRVRRSPPYSWCAIFGGRLRCFPRAACRADTGCCCRRGRARSWPTPCARGSRRRCAVPFRRRRAPARSACHRNRCRRNARFAVALAVNGLAEIALAVEQADGNEGQAHVRGALAVVAGEDAEAAGIDRQAFVEAELGTEIGDQVGACRGGLPGSSNLCAAW
jgi:hypothetical protein